MIDLSTYARLHSLSAVALTEEQTSKSDITLFCFCAILLKVSSTSNELHRRVNFNLQFMRNRQPVNPDLVARKRQREVLLLTSEVRMKTKPQRSTSVRAAGQKKIQEILIICMRSQCISCSSFHCIESSSLFKKNTINFSAPSTSLFNDFWKDRPPLTLCFCRCFRYCGGPAPLYSSAGM